MTPELHVLRVFCDEQERAGNLLGVFPQGWMVQATERQETARRLGFSETVFLTDADTAALEIYTPTSELPFAGHPLVGTAWLLGQSSMPPPLLHPPAGPVPYSQEGDMTWIHARAEYSPTWELLQMTDPGAVIALEGPPEDLGHVQAWAWQDERAGVVRARVFASDYGVAEDPATGSAAIALCASLGRELQVLQGQAGAESEIRVKPLADGCCALGGRVIVDRPSEPFTSESIELGRGPGAVGD